MISIYQLKPRFQALLRPIARSCAIAGITANMVTIAAMLVSLALGTVLAFYGERRDVFRSLAQRRHPQLHDLQAVVEILAERAARDHLAEVPVRGREEAHVDRHRALLTDRSHLG